MHSKFAGFAPDWARLMGLLLMTVCLGLSGCSKIKSAVQSLLHTHRTSKNRPAPHPSHPAVAPVRLAIILDDVGGDPTVVPQIFALHYRLTLSILPNHAHSSEIAKEAHQRGYQVMLHLPMESVRGETAEASELRRGMTSSQVSDELSSMLQTVPYAAGVNNHQGSLATSDAQLMAELMPLLRKHQLFFIDSRTTAATVAYDAAESAGVRCAFRNVPFLDDVQDMGAVRRQLELAGKEAREKGQGIAIGHPHPVTLRALAEFLPEAEKSGIVLVHASNLVQ